MGIDFHKKGISFKEHAWEEYLKAPFGKKRNKSSLKRLKIKYMAKYKGVCQRCWIKLTTDVIQSKTYPDNLATVEHIYPRFDIRRALSERTTLYCTKCNLEEEEIFDTKLWEGYDYETQLVDIIKMGTNE